jgi:hypothetical protein
MELIKKGVKLLSLTFLFIISIAASPLQAYNIVVTGENNAEIDEKSVQAAVDKGGSILLKGTFDFGPKGQVKVTKDVEITGEIDSTGIQLTRINGGFWTFHSPLPTTEPPLPGPGPKVKISNIHFDGATWTPMHFPYISGAEISGNKITNVRPFPIPIKWSGSDTLLVSAGVLMGTRFAHKDKILPGGTTGNLIVAENNIDLRCENPEMTMSQGVFFLWTWGATIEIRSNRIRNVSRNSIESLDNYIDEEGRGSVLISENNVVTPKVGVPFPSPTTPNGIIVGWFLDLSAGSDPSKISKITVIRNFVQANGETSIGIASLSDGGAILGNRVEVGGGSKAGGIGQVGSNAFVARNKIDGFGAHAIRAIPFNECKSNGNTFAWNDVRGFKATAADILFAGNENVFVGARCKLDDKGIANKVLVMH